MKLGEARIGYAGYSRNFSAPGDRRRFAAYARIKGIPIEYADPNREYDIVYVTYSSDLPGWVARKRRDGVRTKMVFELIDGYFTETRPFRRLLKGSGRYILGTDSRFSPDLRRTLADACEVADAVICSTIEQQQFISRLNPNVYVSFDHFEDELGPSKSEYSRTGKLRVLWEGQSTTLPNLQIICEPLNDLKDKVELHVVTDPIIHRYFGRFGAYPAMAAIKGIECEKRFHRWDRSTFSSHITACDAAVIPINRANALWWAKPENKLVMLWQLGMPVLATATPVYRRVMDRAGIDMSCSSTEEWGAQLERLIGSTATDLSSLGRRCKHYATSTYSKDEFLKRFDDAIESMGVSVE